MKKLITLAFLLFSTSFAISSLQAEDLWQVYQQALESDPAFKMAYAQEMSFAEAVPKYRAALLPQIGLTSYAAWQKMRQESNTYYTGASYAHAGSTIDTTMSQRTTDLNLNLTQKIFDFTAWSNLASAFDTVKAAKSTYNAAAQDLMIRTAKAYFSVLYALDVLQATRAEKEALYQEYIKAKQSFEVGVVTITDVYNAKAAYDGAISDDVTAQSDVISKKEDLRAVTGVWYKTLTPLKEMIPLKMPAPNNDDEWVRVATEQNWNLSAARYNAEAARKLIMSAVGGHLPTVSGQTAYDNLFTRRFSGFGMTRQKTPSASLNLTLPIYSGGAVNSAVRKAISDYNYAMDSREKTYRDVVNQTRKAYIGILSGISKVKAEKQVVISNQSSLDGMKEGYKVGTRTMVDVLIAEKTLYNSQKDYASSRYNYIQSIFLLKQAAGTLGADDMASINNWLVSTQLPPVSKTAVQKTAITKTTAQSPKKPATTVTTKKPQLQAKQAKQANPTVMADTRIS